MRKLVLLALLFGGAICAYAGPTEFEFVAWNNGQWQNGFPYVLEEVGGAGPSILFVMCDDYFHGGQPGAMWEANITQLGSDNITLARFNKFVAGPTALSPLTLYDEAGWILLQTLVEPSSQYQAMNSAAWTIFDPNAPCNGNCEGWISNAQNAAMHNFFGADFDKVYIITPVNQYDPDPNSPQEFLAIGSDSGLTAGSGDSTTPEPGTLLLIGSGGLLGIVGRKFRS